YCGRPRLKCGSYWIPWVTSSNTRENLFEKHSRFFTINRSRLPKFSKASRGWDRIEAGSREAKNTATGFVTTVAQVSKLIVNDGSPASGDTVRIRRTNTKDHWN